MLALRKNGFVHLVERDLSLWFKSISEKFEILFKCVYYIVKMLYVFLFCIYKFSECIL